MYNGKKDVKYNNPASLGELDAALNELGVLSTRTAARREYLRENRLNMLINPKYVSNVSIGLKVRHVAPTNRYAPYNLPRREERHRTRSENNDCNDSPGTSLVKAIIESTVDAVDEMSQLKKAKSLESVVGDAAAAALDLDNFRLPEVEAVSSCIEKLRVDDR